MQPFNKFKELLAIKRYSKNTITSYLGLLLAFQKFIDVDCPIHSLTESQLCTLISKYVNDKNIAASSQRQLIAAVRLYLSEMHNRHLPLRAVTPARRSARLPVILNTQEIKAIINAPVNVKHRAMLYTLYATGMRSGELINLRLTDFDKKRKVIHIKDGKGAKDRVIPYPNSLKPILTQYYTIYRPANHVFEGRQQEQYSAQSLRMIFKKACHKAHVKKQVTLHSLRHSYATHLMDNGTDLRLIQKLLGHSNIKTTLVYTHVTQRTMQQVPSPLDFLQQ